LPLAVFDFPEVEAVVRELPQLSDFLIGQCVGGGGKVKVGCGECLGEDWVRFGGPGRLGGGKWWVRDGEQGFG